MCCDGAFKGRIGLTCLDADLEGTKGGKGMKLILKLFGCFFKKGFVGEADAQFSNAVTVRTLMNLILLTSVFSH